MSRRRVDRLLVERGLAPSRTRAQALIGAGKVYVAGAPVARASELVDTTAELTVRELDHPYVSRGGVKLEGALDDLAVDVAGVRAADIGASTGGFTDCLLRRGAARVYAIDVGHDQLHPSLRDDPRVVVMERVNARSLQQDALGELVDLVVVDASFISLEKLLGALVPLLGRGGKLLALVKPQFELGPRRLSRGVVQSDELRLTALGGVVAAADAVGLVLRGSADSRLPGPAGNREIFALFERR